ncbi:hypothetical protein OpiT1DRAFT_01302 [Opitutaceae bacterium TAV1]|nr:hypothetical protein OpiT1DRAFT_01302 [Opitutaceae bacterium TAV1]
MALPAVNFDPSKTIIPTKTYAVWTPAGGGATAVPLIGKIANYEQTLDTVKREAPGTDNLLRADRIVAIRQTEILKLELEDVKLLGEVFGDGRFSGLKNGKVKFYITDPDDALNTAAIITNEFACSVTLDGGMGLTANEVTKATLAFEAKEPVEFEVDASTVEGGGGGA